MSALEFYWAEPDAEIVEQNLIGLAEALDDIEEPMAAAAYLVRDDIQERFKTGTDPSGRPWEDWATEYRQYALRKSAGRIFGDRANLHLTGDLRHALAEPGAYIPTDEGLFLDTSDLPEYWAWNNFGAERTVSGGGDSAEVKQFARNLVISAHRMGERMSGREALAKARKLSGGTNVLPERPFIGLSDKAKAKIIAAFDAWFVGEVQVAQSSRGREFFRHSKRDVLGRFAKR